MRETDGGWFIWPKIQLDLFLSEIKTDKMLGILVKNKTKLMILVIVSIIVTTIGLILNFL